MPSDVVIDLSGQTDRLSHDDLLRLARAIQAAGIVDDLHELSRLAQHLRRALRRHIASERVSQQALPAPLRSVVFGGQDRLLRLAESIARDRRGAAVRLRAAVPSWWWRAASGRSRPQRSVDRTRGALSGDRCVA